jgi:hypothetical protein
MAHLDRRSALACAGALSSLVAALPALVEECAAPIHGERAGEEVAPGVREVFLTSQDVALAAYKLVWMTDLVFRPGASTPADLVANDMVVLLLQGLLRVRLDELELVLKGGNVWAFPKGATLACANTGADVAVMRVIDLLPGL